MAIGKVAALQSALLMPKTKPKLEADEYHGSRMDLKNIYRILTQIF